MSKEGEGLLDQIIKRLQNQQQTEVSATQSAFDQQRLKNEQIDKEYRQLLLPIEQKIFSERTPPEFLKVVADFKSKMEQNIRSNDYGAKKMTFDQIGIFKWGNLSTRAYDLSRATNAGMFGKANIYPDEATKNRAVILEELKSGKLNKDAANYQVLYYYTPDDGRRYPPTYYFGYQSNPDKTITWNISNKVVSIYKDKKDLPHLGETLANILFTKNYEMLIAKSEYPFSNDDRSGRT